MQRIGLSGAGLKLRAANNALVITALQTMFEMVSKKTATGVNEQPYGDAEGFLGAWNRATFVLEAEPTARFGLGAENCLVKRERGVHMDFAYVVLRERDSDEFEVATSAGVVCPERFVELSRATDWAETAGSFYAKETGCDGADWHSHATGGLLTRETILTTPMVDVFARKLRNL